MNARLTRLAALLRRVADRIDPSALAVPQEPPGEPPRFVSRVELRAIQRRALEDVLAALAIAREHDREAALGWLPPAVLAGIAALVECELETRERDLAPFERRPPGTS